MHKTMAATALSFLMAVGGGAAFADASGHGSASATPSTQPSAQQGSRANAPGPVEFEEEEVQTAPWTVERVDKQNRNLVLRSPDGTQNTVNIPAGTPGFDTLKKGDQVALDYFDAAVVGVAPKPVKSSGSNQASGSAKSSNDNAGRTVRNIRKVGDSSHSGQSGGRSSNSRSTH